MAKTVTCVVNGKTVHLSERAFEVAKRYYGAVLVEPVIIEPPFELKNKPLILPPKNISVGEPIKIEAKVSRDGVAEVKESPVETPKARKGPVRSKSKKK